jgi:hypothetical protein
MNIADIEPGKSYACKFVVKTFIDEMGNPVDTGQLSVGEKVPGVPGNYRGFGVIVTRDTANQLVEIWDEHLQRTWIVSWTDTSDVDTVEWIDT